MLVHNRVYVAAAGAGAALSITHYLLHFRSITGQIPVHFNFFGEPDKYAAPWAFVMYPLVSATLSAMLAATTYSASLNAAMPPSSVELLATRGSFLSALVVMLTLQVYAPRIADGSVARLPPHATWLIYGSVGGLVGAVLSSKYVR